ncbi:MAG TPA: hypothetical protein VNB59_02260 [Solirubrobacterales bacterium]|jgi:hypothetical protein|nr:hypothetical protein [Solirubrobacterales bacterium]
MTRRLIAIVTDELRGPEAVEEICADADGEGVEVRVVVPAVEASPLRHTLGDVDEPKEQAEERLEGALRVLREKGIAVSGEVGDPDPVQAAQDALLKAPADEVLIFEHAEGQEQWYENGLFERARESLEPPLRMVVVETADGRPDHIVEREEAARGTVNPYADKEVGGGAYIPGLTRSDLGGMLAGILGTIVVAILAAAVAGGNGHESGWEAAAILIAIGVALANLAHVVGLTLFESVSYHGGFSKFFRTLALVVTPVAVVANLLILLFA